jgi:hypothetical protein
MRVSKTIEKNNKKNKYDILDKIPEKKYQKNSNILTITKINSPLDMEDPFVLPKSSTISERKILFSKENKNKILLSSFRTNKFSNLTNNKSLYTNDNNERSLSKNNNSKIKLDRKSPTSKGTILRKHFEKESIQPDICLSKKLVLPSIPQKDDSYPSENIENFSSLQSNELKIKTNSSNRVNSNSKRISRPKIQTRQSLQEESVERYTSVRKNFKDKKLHIFNKSEKLFYVTYILT